MGKVKDFNYDDYSKEELRVLKSVNKITGMSLNYIAECLEDFRSINHLPKAGELVRYIKYKFDGPKMFKEDDCGRRVPWTKEDYLRDSIVK